MLHEIPQEISDYALLLYSGFSRRKALLWNFISGVASLIGAIIALLAVQWMSGLTEVLLALAAGNFLYIAGTDLIPELHKDTHPGRAVLQLFLISAGIAVMYGLTMLE
jgi:zinc and cadmium transporter